MQTSPTLHLVDPALAAAVTSTSAPRLMHDLPTAGLWFESQVVQHLRVFAEALDGRVYHYRDKAGKEADAVAGIDTARTLARSGNRNVVGQHGTMLSYDVSVAS
ncbi:DUF4143 domain-containing protein [Actinomyces sp. 2119]|uniref:DUF4143 domain-containing protein n=1 Tax=Actinomyces sp. 2119 TaxID=2321393 RepID=UPI002175CB23